MRRNTKDESETDQDQTGYKPLLSEIVMIKIFLKCLRNFEIAEKVTK